MSSRSRYDTTNNFSNLKDFTKKAAKELGYPIDVVNSIDKANSRHQINLIMRKARHKYLYEEGE